MRIIGITGGIGSGKSTVLRMLEGKYSAYIVETDKLAHSLMRPGQNAYIQITEAFGTEILNEDKTINRERLGSIVFKDKEALEQLNKIVHPAVKEYIRQDIDEKRASKQIMYYVIEAALLIEDGYKEICDELWYVYVEKEERIRRLLNSRGGDCKKWENIINNQSSEEFYRTYCDEIIDNGKNVEDIETAINELLFRE